MSLCLKDSPFSPFSSSRVTFGEDKHSPNNEQRGRRASYSPGSPTAETGDSFLKHHIANLLHQSHTFLVDDEKPLWKIPDVSPHFLSVLQLLHDTFKDVSNAEERLLNRFILLSDERSVCTVKQREKEDLKDGRWINNIAPEQLSFFLIRVHF
ncbi:uncharacterized [Tachysurus ichikawai]